MRTVGNNITEISKPRQLQTVIITNVHTDPKTLSVFNDLKKLAQLEKILFLDESLSITSSPFPIPFWLPLENLYVKELRGAIISSLYLKHQLIDVEEYVNVNIEKERNVIKTGSIFVLQSILHLFRNLLHFLDKDETLKYQFKISLSKHNHYDYNYLLKIDNELKIIKKLGWFSINTPTIATKENIEKFTHIVGEIFRLKDDLIYIYETLAKTTAELLSCRDIKYKSHFEKIPDILNESLHRSFLTNLTNLFMAENINSAVQQFKMPIIVMVGAGHVRDDHEQQQRGIPTILRDDFNFKKEEIEIIDVSDEDFNLDKYLDNQESFNLTL